MDLALELDDEPFTAKVRVADSSRDGETPDDAEALYLTGLEFLSLPPGGEILLRRFLDREQRRKHSGT
jgi:hypothetical protein